MSEVIALRPRRPTMSTELPCLTTYSVECPDYSFMRHMITRWFLRRQIFKNVKFTHCLCETDFFLKRITNCDKKNRK